MDDIEELENQQRVDMFNRELPFVKDTLAAPLEWPGYSKQFVPGPHATALEETSVLPNGRTVPWYQDRVNMQIRKWGKAAGKYAAEQADPPSRSAKRLERVALLQQDDSVEDQAPRSLIEE